jgi:hypothetical protein
VIRFARDAAGRVTGSFTSTEADIVADLAAQLCGMLGGLAGDATDPLFATAGIGGSSRRSDDPAIARLLPDAYADAAEAGEFRQLTERGLAARKVENARTVIATLATGDGTVVLDDAQAQAWLRTLADLRLTIAARLGIQLDGDEPAAGTDAELALTDLYEWLAFVTETLIEAIES